MTRDEYKAQLANEFLSQPQKAYLAEMALSSIFSGIDELAKLGHKFELAPVVASAVAEWPKMLYRDVKDSDGRVLRVENHTVAGPDEVGRLGEGWRDAPLAEAPVSGPGLAPWPKTLYRDRVDPATGGLVAIETRQVADSDEQTRVLAGEPGWRLTERGGPAVRLDDPYGMKPPTKPLAALPVVPVGQPLPAVPTSEPVPASPASSV